MNTRLKLAGLALVLLLLGAGLGYVYLTPWNRIAGVRIGGELTAAPADWTALPARSTGQLKLAGFPPFVINVSVAVYQQGFITMSRPDDGYWAGRVRNRNQDGWIRVGDQTWPVRARELHGQERLDYVDVMRQAGIPVDESRTGPNIIGVAEPMATWEFFHWTPR